MVVTEEIKTGTGSVDPVNEPIQETTPLPEEIKQEPANNNEEAGVFTVPGVNDQVTRQVPEQPTVVEEPKIEPIVEPVAPKVEPIEQPIVEPVQPVAVDEIKPTEPTKIKTAQDIKSQELVNQATEEAQRTTDIFNKTNEFNEAVKAGNLEEMQRIARENPDMRGAFNNSVKQFFGTKANTDYFNTYSGMSNDQMLSEVKNGNLVVGSEQYKLLGPEQRASFEQFQAQDQAIVNTDPKATQDQFAVDTTQTISLSSMVAELQSVFSSDLKAKFNEVMNSEEITNTAKGLEDLQNQVNSTDDELERVGDEVRAEFPNLPLSAQNAIINDRSKNILRKKNTLVNQYNSKLGTYRTLKDSAQQELDFFKWEDANNKEVYMTALGLYETRRKEMREDQKIKFLEDNKKLASETQFNRQKELAEFNQELKQNNLGGGKYIDNGKGDLVYIKNGEQISVLTGLGEDIGTSEDENYTYQIKTNEDGSYTVFGLPKEGTNIFQQSFSADGEPAASWIEGTGQGNITSYGGEHDKFQGLDIDGNVGDPIASPMDAKVVDFEFHPAYGTTMVVETEDGNKLRYSHLDKGFFRVGDEISKGTILGTIGNSGNVLKLDGKKPTRAELNAGFGSHLDLVTTGPDGKVRSAKQTEQYLNNLGLGDQITGVTEDTQLAQGILNGTSQLSDFTPTDKKNIVPELNKLLNAQLTDDNNRNVILKSAVSTKDISDSALNKIQDMETVKFQLGALEGRLEEIGVGPFEGRLRQYNPYDTEAQVALAQLAGLTPKVARGIFGEVGVLTDTDIANYQKALPNLKSTAEKNELVIDFMRDLLTAGYKNAIVTQAKGGRNMSQFLNDYDIMSGFNRVDKYTNPGQTFTTSSGYSYNTSGTTQAQNDFFNQ